MPPNRQPERSKRVVLHPGARSSASFNIPSGTPTVGNVRVQMRDATHTTMLLQVNLPVQYQFH
ncbi:MAG TPA: hypothetical protein VMJ64_16145 [Anaerolineales bacterium]|nr:hypothetical protein [Anaerolineales bacterium]